MEWDSGGGEESGEVIPGQALRLDGHESSLEGHGDYDACVGGTPEPGEAVRNTRPKLPVIAGQGIAAGAYSCSICLDLMLDPVVGEFSVGRSQGRSCLGCVRASGCGRRRGNDTRFPLLLDSAVAAVRICASNPKRQIPHHPPPLNQHTQTRELWP